ncbi:hypothetical protein EYC84_000694 [Monilinia fructicola]|uniref:Uncharacterized protein n=1 Tax=Monilinia fructicola TaxID=38448 RepID=A0A5M9JIA0_MONFR|nr:hypothetical protein EYC84_000694 [Monilinia fructicola]
MIRRHISAAHICLRCQIRLGQRPLPFLTRRTYSTELAADYEGNEPGASDGQSQYNGSEKESNGDTESFTERAMDPERPREWPPEHQNDIVIRRPYAVIKPPRYSRVTKHFSGSVPKVYGHTGIKQFGDSVILSGVDTLGKSAEVLVLRDSKVKFYKKKARGIGEDPAPESIDILATIQSERGIISSKDVETNINEFRPLEDEVQTWEEFNDLVQSLQDSFTVAQLKMYIQSYPKTDRMRKVPSLGVRIPDDEEAIVQVTPWIPEISPISQPIDDSPLRGYSPSSYNHKQTVAVRILRECWRLEVPELVEGIGEVEVQVHIKDLDFLISQGYLDSVIKRYYLNEPEKIEIYRPRQVLRITSTREKSALIVAEIQDGFRSIRRDELQLKELCHPRYRSDWESRALTPGVLAKLGELTKTDIRSLKNQEPALLVSSMITDPESRLSNRVDVVRRLLLDLAHFHGSYQTSRKIGLRNFKESSHQVELPGAFIRFPGSRELSWHEKLRTWSRWITATPKSPKEDHLPEKAQYQFPFNTAGVNILGESQEDSNPEGAEFLWSHEYSPTTSIKAGTVLHNISSRRIDEQVDDDERGLSDHGTVSPDETLNTNKLETEMDNGAIRIFSTQAPNLSGLFQSDHIDNTVSHKPNQELVLYFKPNPWALCPNGEPIGPSALNDFPPIEMSFTIDPKSFEARLRDIHAIVSTETADLMLPELKADLQFERKIRSSMLMKDSKLDGGLDGLKSAASAVKDFVENSQLDLSSDQQLETPPKLILPLAKHLCTKNAWERMARKPHLGLDVEYLFTKLEYRKTAVYNFDNHEIICTSIEAGKAGGSRLELSLTSRSMPSQDEMDKTMKAALKMVELMDMKNITSVYGQMREVYPERKEPVLGPDDFKFVPKRPSDFLDVKVHYELDEEKEARFGKKLSNIKDDDWSTTVQKPGRDSHNFKGQR